MHDVARGWCLRCIRKDRYAALSAEERLSFHAQHVPAHFARAVLADLSAGVQKHLAEMPDRAGLYCHGPVGTGKTHLLAALAHARLAEGHAVCWRSFADLIGEVRAAFGAGSVGGDQKLIEAFASAEHLFIDDLGINATEDRRETDFTRATFLRILDLRVHRGLPTYLSSNVDVKRVGKAFDERVASRLLMLHQMSVAGADRRVTQANAQRAKSNDRERLSL
jgi:DNA replication protein DnaC